jgi:hypothetical protein
MSRIRASFLAGGDKVKTIEENILIAALGEENQAVDNLVSDLLSRERRKLIEACYCVIASCEDKNMEG